MALVFAHPGYSERPFMGLSPSRMALEITPRVVSDVFQIGLRFAGYARKSDRLGY